VGVSALSVHICLERNEDAGYNAFLISTFSFDLAMQNTTRTSTHSDFSPGENYGTHKTRSIVSRATLGFTLLLELAGLSFYNVLDGYPFLNTQP
jgi:hypothetical protein